MTKEDIEEYNKLSAGVDKCNDLIIDLERELKNENNFGWLDVRYDFSYHLKNRYLRDLINPILDLIKDKREDLIKKQGTLLKLKGEVS